MKQSIKDKIQFTSLIVAIALVGIFVIVNMYLLISQSTPTQSTQTTQYKVIELEVSIDQLERALTK